MTHPASVLSESASTPDWQTSIVARSPAMRELLAKIARVAPSSIPVLLHGETGSGKDVAARAIHEASGRAGPFVALNCATLPPSLAESELFGHTSGAFTGAVRTRAGVIEEANGGTLLLDEVAELDLGTQAKLLRVVEDGLVRRVGTTSGTTVNVRLIAASHRNLANSVSMRTFREDLYHRLAGVTLTVPPLRNRPEDLGPLLRSFLEEACDGRGVPTVDDLTIACLRNRPWPGNIRELRQSARRAVLFGGPALRYRDFVEGSEAPAPVEDGDLSWLLGQKWRDIEAQVLTWAMHQYGSLRAASEVLGLPRSTLVDRLRRAGVPTPELRLTRAAHQ